jgi:hypothetical protein
MKLARFLPILLVPAAIVGWLGCADISSPSRADRYEWRRIVATGPGTTDTLSFHWGQLQLPVAFWVQDTLDFPARVRAGIAQWKAAFLYREFDGILVSDSAGADVVVRAGPPVKGGFDIIRLQALAPECEGGTDFDLPAGSHELQLPIRVFVNPRFDPASPGVDECLDLTMTHELGHALGIFAHSPNADDIMYSDPVVSELSARDRSTVEAAYHLQPTLTVNRR